MQLRKLVLAAVMAFGLGQAAQAAVINSANVGGFTTFQDTNTGRIWLDMNNFFDASATNGTTGYAMITAAQNAGFTFATRTDVSQLLGSLPLSGNWSTYANVMGYGAPRQLIWGMYDDQNGNPFGWAWSFSGDQQWSYTDNSTDANGVQNGGSAGAVDMGIWAYQTGQVPEPTSVALLGLAAAGLAVARRRRA